MRIGFLILLWIAVAAQARDIYVDASANPSSANGTFVQPFHRVQEAIDQGLFPGDVVHIKAGIYPAGQFKLRDSGTEQAPIRFIGYRETPGDSPSASDPRLGLYAEEMPLIKGTDRSTGIAIDLNGMDHVHIEYIQILDYRLGIRNILAPREESTGIVLRHIIGRQFGMADNGVYSGWGILIDDTGNILEDCIIIDAGAEGIGIYGDENVMRDCKVANYSDRNATDYFIVVWGNNNQIIDCTIHRDRVIASHSGHGFGVKNGTDNLFIGCTSVNTNKGFYVSGPECTGNEFRDCVAQNEVGIVIRDGAHHNLFRSCVITDTEVAVRFIDSIEFGEQTDGVGEGNVILNSLFEHNLTAIEFRAEEYGSPVYNNLFHSCVFNDAEQFLSIRTEGSGNHIQNCVISGMRHLD